MGKTRLIGILADSHGHVRRLRKGIAELKDRGAGLLIHLGDMAEAFSALRSHGDGRAEKHRSLIGADIRSGFFAADVLLAGREGEHKAAAAFDVHRFSHNAAGKGALEGVAGRQKDRTARRSRRIDHPGR